MGSSEYDHRNKQPGNDDNREEREIVAEPGDTFSRQRSTRFLKSRARSLYLWQGTAGPAAVKGFTACCAVRTDDCVIAEDITTWGGKMAIAMLGGKKRFDHYETVTGQIL